MVLYLDRLELLIEKWQLRRKTIEISQKPPSRSSKASECKRTSGQVSSASDTSRVSSAFVEKREREQKQQQQLKHRRELRAKPERTEGSSGELQNKENNNDSRVVAAAAATLSTGLDTTKTDEEKEEEVAITVAAPAAASVAGAPSSRSSLASARTTGKFVEPRGERVARDERRRMEPAAAEVTANSSELIKPPKQQHHKKQQSARIQASSSGPPLLQRRRVPARTTKTTISGHNGGASCSRLKICPSLLLYASLALTLVPPPQQAPSSASGGHMWAPSVLAAAVTPVVTAPNMSSASPSSSSSSSSTSGGQQPSLQQSAGSSPSRLINAMVGWGLSKQAIAALAAGGIRNLWPLSSGLRRPHSTPDHVAVVSGSGGSGTILGAAAGGSASNNAGGGLRRQSPFGQISKAFESLRRKIGARNSIRMHNAFRDLIWKTLDNFSMPTPVIYELRRQNIYPIDEDLKNDSLFDKNTTLTIRAARRSFGADEKRIERRRAKNSGGGGGADDDDDDDDDNKNRHDRNERFRKRLLLRFDDLLRLSHRSLFGQVVRVPALFPFKRQEEDEDDADEAEADDSTEKKSAKRYRRRLLRRVRHRLSGGEKDKQEPEPQMIFINGKQFYVNDNGELKEVVKGKQSADKNS